MFTRKSSLNNLENIQKRALRFVCNDFVSNYSELLETMWLSRGETHDFALYGNWSL